MTWRLHTDGDLLHVWPETDAIGHDTEADPCPCGPTAEPVKRADGSVGWILIHHPLAKESA